MNNEEMAQYIKYLVAEVEDLKTKIKKLEKAKNWAWLNIQGLKNDL